MSRFAALLMFFAWFLYGAMPAVATPSMPVAVERAAPGHAQDRGHGRHDHGRKVETAQSEHSHGDARKPCPHGGKSCVAPFCSACVTLPPEIATGDDSRFIHAYPAPALAQTLVSPDPAPLTPPPRA